MAQKTSNITPSLSLWQRINPANLLRRALYTSVGPLKDWANWKWLLNSQNRAKVAVNSSTAQSIPAFWRAINIVAEQIASLPVSVYTVDGAVTTENTTHPLWRVLKVRPSQQCSRFDFFETLVRVVFIFGACFIRPIRDGRGAIVSFEFLPLPYDFTQPGENLFYHFKVNKEVLTLRWDEVLVIKAWSMDGLSGQSPIRVLQDIFGSAIAQIQYGASYFGNGTHLSGLLIPEQPMTPTQFMQAKTAWESSAGTGAESAGNTTMLPFGLKYQQLASNLTDSDFVAARNLTVQDVANITGVPMDLLNAGDKASTYASAEERTRQFVLFTLRTWAKRIEDEFNSKLFSPREQRTTYVRFNLNSLLRGDVKARATYYNIMLQNGVLTRNEVRALEDFNPVDGADELFVPLNMQAIGTDITPDDEA